MGALLGLPARTIRLVRTLWGQQDSRQDLEDKFVLILGGCQAREIQCAKLSTQDVSRGLKNIFLILSSGASTAEDLSEAVSFLDPSRVTAVKEEEKEDSCLTIGPRTTLRITVDRKAVDTLSNFTTLVEDLTRMSCRTVFIATSESHMRRALPVARVVFGASGIRAEPLRCSDYFDSHAHQETLPRVVRDLVRAVVWLLTTLEGRSLSLYVHPERRNSAGQLRSASTLTWHLKGA